MNVVYVTGAIYEACDGVEQPGTDNVADLKTGVVIAVPERRKFNKPLVISRCGAEFLRKYGVGNSDIFRFASAVGDTDASVVSEGQMVIKIGTDSLYRGRVNRCGVEWQSNALHPNACNELNAVLF